MECRHDFEDTLHDTIQGTAWMGILFLFGATVMTFWAWYVALLDTRDISSAGREEQLKEAAMNVNVAVREGKIAHMDAGLEVRKLEEHMDKLRDAQIYSTSWKSTVGIFHVARIYDPTPAPTPPPTPREL
jgi:hypothetical protein